ncbi:hypothetical protein BCR42DRAFT_430262 [Absidia repens]|uniref:protein-tyrosine-phosphatase n=1 Tax=Absidia repens TaxID=90262 RepID=A0A1X2HK91_9FUNG|nr:hypothetical protein BCR42DRAFT_430262 [Absidia repens]
MLFPRYRKPKRLDDDDDDDSTPSTVPKKSSLADAFFRKLPIAFTRRTRSKTSLLSSADESGVASLPRHSTSLPNIAIEKHSPLSSRQTRGAGSPSLSTSTHSYKRQRCTTSVNPAPLPHRQRHSLLFEHVTIQKRHSIQPELQQLSKLTLDTNTNTSANTDSSKQRHSYTFGKQQEMKKLSLKDLVLDASQEKKLDLFLAQRQAPRPACGVNQPTTLGTSSTPSLVVPQRSSSHQLLSPPKKLLIRAHSTSSSSIHQQQEDTTEYHHSPLDSATLYKMLEEMKQRQTNNNIMLIDVRHLVDYQRQRICGSLNVNLPSLLIKRYQRGAVSNFHLENFITTAEGREHYLAQRQASTNSTTSSSTSTLSSELIGSSLSSSPSSLSSSPLTPTSSSAENDYSNKGIIWVVYDADMNEQYKSTQAWTLLNVLCKAAIDTEDQVHYLAGGFHAFITDDSQDAQRWIEGTDSDISMKRHQNNSYNDLHSYGNSKDQTTLSLSTSSGTPTLQQKRLSKVSPRRSLSYTIGDGTKIQQQTSLFSLDTQAARENNANALARRANRRSQQLQQQQLSNQQHLAGKDEGDKNNNRLRQPAAITPIPSKLFNKHNNDNNNNDNCIQHDPLDQRIHNNNINNSSASLLSIPSLHSTTTGATGTSYSSSSTSLASSSSSFSVSPTMTPIAAPPPPFLSSTASLSLSSSSSSSKTTLIASAGNGITTTSNNPPFLARVMEEEDDDELIGQMTADISPRTETDFDFTISEIIPGFLYVGPEIETNEQAEQLLARPIRRVLNMAEECHDRPLEQHHDHLIYRKIAARDTVEMRNIDNVMMEAVGFIEEAKRYHEAIYVHCKAGKSRSVTVILAYLVSCEKWTLKQSYRHVIKARPNMSPNIGFIAELMKLENQVHGRVSSFMETDWHTASLPSPGFAHELQKLQSAWERSPSTPTVPSHLLNPPSV